MRNAAGDLQVQDDPALLARMMDDLRAADDLYRPTNYWAYYEERFLPELRRHGLHGFRRRRRSILSSFGATDLPIHTAFMLANGVPGGRTIGRLLDRVLRALSPLVRLDVVGLRPEAVTPYFHQLVKARWDALGLPLASCPTTRFGDPEDCATIDGGAWSLVHLTYCSMLADVARHAPLAPDLVYCEVGAGMGRQVEVLGRLLPRATLLVFDIPPQLYVAHQYLRSAFGPRLLPYDEAMALSPAGGLPDACRGRIVLLPTSRMPAWSKVRADVFWNSASFQEMEPHVVRNYLALAAAMDPTWVYINAMPVGNSWGEWRPGRGGTKERVVSTIYADALRETHEVHAEWTTDYFLETRAYRSWLFRRRELVR